MALATSSSVRPFFLNNPNVKIEGNFSRSHLPKAKLPNSPIDNPIAMNLNTLRILLVVSAQRLRLSVVGDRRNIVTWSPTSPEKNPHRP
ncbi:hypothetical protein Hanom_Chr16g01476821 [Helianthus anomalus]